MDTPALHAALLKASTNLDQERIYRFVNPLPVWQRQGSGQQRYVRKGKEMSKAHNLRRSSSPCVPLFLAVPFYGLCRGVGVLTISFILLRATENKVETTVKEMKKSVVDVSRDEDDGEGGT